MAEEQLYFLAITPPEPIYSEVYEYKEYFLEHHRSKAALNSPPHITLHMPFKLKAKKEVQLVDKLLNFKPDISPFDIRLRDFQCFAPRVIYVDVLPADELLVLQKGLIKFMKVNFNLFNADYKGRAYHPHMTVAFRDLRKSEFEAAWGAFKEEKYQASFSCNQFVLLKHNGKNWDVFKEFVF